MFGAEQQKPAICTPGIWLETSACAQNNVLGVTSMPWYNALSSDGEVLHPWTLPGGLYNGYNLGNTCAWRHAAPSADAMRISVIRAGSSSAPTRSCAVQGLSRDGPLARPRAHVRG